MGRSHSCGAHKGTSRKAIRIGGVSHTHISNKDSLAAGLLYSVCIFEMKLDML